jgi:hypothetical protein
MIKKLLFAVVCIAALSSCDLYTYGQLGNADQTQKFSGSEYDQIMSSLSGVWYSHYAGIGRLDGYRIGKWEDFDELVEDSGKTALFPDIKTPYQTYTGTSGGPGSEFPGPADYFVLYDDTVYGQADSGSGGNGSWGFAYCGIVRAVNIFNGDPDRGAIIIEYLKGGAPQWDDDIKDGQRPFFGIYYRVLNRDTVQMANAVDLEALYHGKKYYTEKENLDEAIELNSVENEAEFIAWGVVIPQDRE